MFGLVKLDFVHIYMKAVLCSNKNDERQ